MGGGHHFEYPKWVWSPSGGWWPKPLAWKRNTAIFGCFAALTSLYAYTYATPRTVAYHRKAAPPASEATGQGHH